MSYINEVINSLVSDALECANGEEANLFCNFSAIFETKVIKSWQFLFQACETSPFSTSNSELAKLLQEKLSAAEVPTSNTSQPLEF